MESLTTHTGSESGQELCQRLRLDRSSGVPLYLQLADQLRAAIVTGTAPAGSRLPSEPALCQALHVSRSTVLHAIDLLVQEGLVYRERGSGTFVRPRGGLWESPTPVRPLRVGIVSPSQRITTSNPYVAGILEGIGNALQGQNVSTLIDLQPEASLDFLAWIQREDVDGFVVIAPKDTDRPALRALARNRIPFVLVGARFSEPWPAIVAGNREAGATAAQQLIAAGYQRLAILTSDWTASDSRERAHGFLDATKHLGHPVAARDICILADQPWWEDQAYDWIRARLQQVPRPDGIFAAGVTIATGVLRAIREYGLAIPQQIGLVAFDDFPPLAHLNPPVTTLRQPLEAMGRLAAAHLLEIMRGKHPHPIPPLAVEWVERESLRTP